VIHLTTATTHALHPDAMKEQSPDPSPETSGGGFVRSVLTLGLVHSRRAVAPSFAVPALARLYTPAEYGVLAVYSSILTMLVVVASLRYEAAIPLLRDESSAGSPLVLRGRGHKVNLDAAAGRVIRGDCVNRRSPGMPSRCKALKLLGRPLSSQ
jgi:hypothetical protein